MPYVDGSFPSGSPILLNGAGTPYKCNSFTPSPSAETVQITDENGAHSGALQFVGPLTFTAELQYANSSVAEITTAAQNSTLGVFINVNIHGANHNCFVTQVSTNKPQRGPWTASVTGQARVNA